MGSAEEQDIVQLQYAVEQKQWQEVNILLDKKHCMKFFTKNTLPVSNVSDIYINSVVNGHQQIEKAADKFFDAQKVPTTLIIQALEHQNAKLFFENLTKHGNEYTLGLILRYSRWECVNTQLLQNCPKILGILSKYKDFPSKLYLVKFLQDLQKEITNKTDCSATKEAILILTSAQDWSFDTCCEIIQAQKPRILKEGEKELLESVLADHVFRPMKSAHNLGQPVSTQIIDKVRKPQEVKQEPVVEEVEEVEEEEVKKEEVVEVVEKSVPREELFNPWQEAGQKLGIPLRWGGYPLLKQYGKSSVSGWIPKDDHFSINHNSLLGNSAFSTFSLDDVDLSSEVD